MRSRRLGFVVLLICLPLVAAASSPILSVLSLQPDGNGGCVAFALLESNTNFSYNSPVVAIPIDPSGTPHSERAVTMYRDGDRSATFEIARMANGYMMAYVTANAMTWVA